MDTARTRFTTILTIAVGLDVSVSVSPISGSIVLYRLSASYWVQEEGIEWIIQIIKEGV